MITASELLASAHEADRQLKALSDAAEELRQAEPMVREVQRKLVALNDAAKAVLSNKPLVTQLGSLSTSVNGTSYIARDTAHFLGKLYQDNRLDELI